MGIDILVPVLNRPQNAAKVAESLKVTKEPYRLVFICSPNDEAQIEASRKVADVLVVDWNPGKADFAKKINTGFSETSSEWVFQGADDIVFSEGWDTAALRSADRKKRRVVGTNDLHNPAVIRGKHSTHTLFARSYIDEHGGTLDGKGLVFCELYDHQYVDVEFVEVAKRRNEFIHCHQSVVEHFHPHWGNAERDATYTKSSRLYMADRRLYMQRMGGVRPRQSQRMIERQERLRAARQERQR
jgi:hypothetical protein